jgi:hypothetical protein
VVDAQATELPDLGIQVDPDVADFMGAFEETAVGLDDLDDPDGDAVEAWPWPLTRKTANPFTRSCRKDHRGPEAGVAPWQKLWRPGEVLAPMNPVSGTVYSGINRVMLSPATASTTRAG